MERTKAWRRFQEKRWQEKRAKYLEQSWYENIRDVKYFGYLKNGHFGCGCAMCKPWKHKIESKYKVSERRRMQDEEI